ncbi:T9SS type A sorting domain-containing protein [Polaribacter sp.]|uniref:T9SS type A sorting domain-containing protein n=1 Tax=Polaribacter sp. TaxID=1920175 RepID=UPI003EFAFE49
MKKNTIHILVFLLCSFSINISFEAQVLDPELGLRADWLRGTYGLNWKPGRGANGVYEGRDYTIEHFLDQIKHLKTVDYIQVHLNESSIYSPVHAGTHALIESFWEGDTSSGNPINLVVPRASIGRDPFLEVIKAVKAAGLKVQVYVNSSNMLRRVGNSSPDDFPDVTNRWMNWCDTDATAQAFLNSKSYHTDGDNENRPYMFCYAEYILKDYAIRYGDLIDAWCFDSGRYMWQYGGDNQDSDDVNEQRIYQAFADACHAGNPEAAVSFQNSPGSNNLVDNPFTPATLFCDYMFGHPFNGGKNVGDNPANEFIIKWTADRNGYAHINDGKTRTWDDKVVGHYDPPMSSTKWNAGSEPGVSNDVFAEYYGKMMLGNGAVSFGIPLNGRYNFENKLLSQDWAMVQLELLEDYLSVHQFPGAPNWARQHTVLPDATVGEPYLHNLIDGVDFWDSEGDIITKLFAVETDTFPSWLTILETQAGVWTLSGTPTETALADYDFRLRVEDATGGNNRWVNLKVNGGVLATDTKELDKESFNLFPNPVNNTISLNIPIHSAKIIDLTGKVVKTYDSEIKKLDVSNLQSGIYILKGLSTDGIKMIKKFVK